MGRTAPKAAGNVFYTARFEAAKYNERLYSREGAADEVLIDQSKLMKIELGTAVPNPDEVAQMADVYNSPGLKNTYCSTMCPLGSGLPKVVDDNLDRISVKALATFRKVETAKELLLDISEDGIVDETEMKDMNKIIATLTEIEQISAELKVFVAKQKGTAVRKGV